jgi:hypothetical protein
MRAYEPLKRCAVLRNAGGRQLVGKNQADCEQGKSGGADAGRAQPAFAVRLS